MNQIRIMIIKPEINRVWPTYLTYLLQWSSSSSMEMLPRQVLLMTINLTPSRLHNFSSLGEDSFERAGDTYKVN